MIVKKTCQKEIQTKLAKGLLDMIILQYLDHEPMHGYQIITRIRKDLGIYFGPSTVYPFLSMLEDKGYVTSRWDTTRERPRKVYSLTANGESALTFTETSLVLICKNLSIVEHKVTLNAEVGSPTLVGK